MLHIETPLGKDELVLNEFIGTEKISELFSFILHCHSASESVNPYDLVGKEVDFSVQAHDGSWRAFHGLVTGFAPVADGSGQPHYRLRVAPRLWILTLSSDNRIHQDKDVKEILMDVFDRHGVLYDVSGLSGTYEKREYCVQYKETAFNFVSRLMEDEGIFYWFKHEPGKHTLMLGDSVSAYQPAAEAEVAYRSDPQNASGEALLTAWEREHSFTAGNFVASDYDYNQPDVNLENTLAADDGCAQMDSLELYQFPAMRKTSAAVKASVENGRDAHLALTDVATGAGCCRGFSPGLFFTLGDAPFAEDLGKTFVLTGVEHRARGSRQKVGAGDSSRPDYENTFTCIPKERVARPLRKTPVPVVNGVETAIVTGPEGEKEEYTDVLGRVKVHFMWDRENAPDDQSSCWVRVMHSQTGGLSVPDIGQEVIIAFEHGSPDRPIVTGALYNGINDADQTEQSFWEKIADVLTNKNLSSVLNGYDIMKNAYDGAVFLKGVPLWAKVKKIHNRRNHLIFRENRGSELVDLYAEKTLSLMANKDSLHAAMRNSWHAVGDDYEIDVGKDFTQKIKGNKKYAIDGEVEQNIGKSLVQKIKEDMHCTIEGDIIHEGRKSKSLTIDDKYGVRSKTIELKADDAIILKVGGNTLEITKDGISIDASKISVKATGTLTLDGSLVDIK